ncbi:MAG: dGTPase [Oceanospirillaceae bacterium]|mgnify:CR=1 FL=1|nr:dGTPase [Oceanospirillaceae bacterium]MBT11181.1 dGTPase [Oceanospirillaceae bacterium]
MSVDFTQRITGKRQSGDNSAALATFESDRGRIINSAAVRRLQQKTQVFPLERNAAVRSRLTHSMEVQQVGRHICQTIVKQLADQQLLAAYGLNGLERQFESIVDMSCLMHDIGNPPFGHFGESAINQWFRQHIDDLFTHHDFHSATDESRLKALFSRRPAAGKNAAQDAIKRDLCTFEGNAQGLRIVHTLQSLNLTYSQLSGLLKYTRRGDQEYTGHGMLQKKAGFYLSEAGLMNDLRKALNMQPQRRSPFAYVMEAADDISYCIADIEDAVEKGILRITELPGLLNDQFDALMQSDEFDVPVEQAGFMQDVTQAAQEALQSAQPVGNFFIRMRVEINRKSVPHASLRFIDNIDAVFNGSFDQALMEDGSGYHALLESLKQVAYRHVFCHPEVEARELQGYRIITGLLETYRPLLELDRTGFRCLLAGEKKTPLYETRLFKKLPEKHLAAYTDSLEKLDALRASLDSKALARASDDIWEFYFRCRLILDYISGMTDQFAYDEYKLLNVMD